MRGCLLQCGALRQSGSLGSNPLARLFVIDAGTLVVDQCLHLFPEPLVVGRSQVGTLHSIRRGSAALVLLSSGGSRLELGGVDADLSDAEALEVSGQRLELAPGARLPSRSRQRLAGTPVVDDHAQPPAALITSAPTCAPALTRRRRVPWSMVLSGARMSPDLEKRFLERSFGSF